MKQFSIDEYLKNPNRKVVTRDGSAVKIHCTNYIGAQHIIAQVEGDDYSTSFHEDGRYANDRDDSHLDLFFAPEKKEGWINVYRQDNRQWCGNVFDTESDAKQNGRNAGCLATIKIEWEE